MTYAGFWRRVAASIIDSIILGLFNSIVMAVWSILDPIGLEFSQFGFVVILNWIYYADMESSRLQATVGKICIGIKVTDVDGAPISFGRATGRYFGRSLSVLLLCVGVIMVAFTAKKQGLHDKMARCLVVNKSPRSTLFGEYSPGPDRPPT